MAGIADEISSSANFMSMSPTSLSSPYNPWLRDLKSDERGLLLIHLLLNCATHVAAGNMDQANAFLEKISFFASPDGDTMQRIASYFTEALARRLLRSFPGVYRALNPELSDSSFASRFHARCLFLNLFPFLRLSYLVSNQAILETMDGEKVVHVVDLSGSDPNQWIALLQSLAARKDGPPHLRITAVGESSEFLSHMASILSNEAEKLDIPFQFHAVISRLEALDVKSLRVKTGEALAITSLLQLHPLLAAADDSATQRRHLSSKIDSFMSSLWSLSPKIMLITEQESNHNGSSLKERFMEALYYYAAMFDCLESTVPRQSAERARVEKLLFGEEIKNIIACEGLERKERHEKLERWMKRLEMAGFWRVGLSYVGLIQARRMLQRVGFDGYQVKEENGNFFLCWQERALFSVSAWSFRRCD
ncbi:scarecrow-like protein 3 [Phalaenopsis equestris]|uniref:scarecrow-like protein 3 n=1 Tax=Phalaenopsis equestris TaxID=78828 RepID=UPI0009E2EF52|nr:scarecrow-like protein 3 [Phalaenopsis equestris]